MLSYHNTGDKKTRNKEERFYFNYPFLLINSSDSLFNISTSRPFIDINPSLSYSDITRLTPSRPTSTKLPISDCESGKVKLSDSKIWLLISNRNAAIFPRACFCVRLAHRSNESNSFLQSSKMISLANTVFSFKIVSNTSILIKQTSTSESAVIEYCIDFNVCFTPV